MAQKYTADSSEVGADQTGSMLQCAIYLAFTSYYSILPQPDLLQQKGVNYAQEFA